MEILWKKLLEGLKNFCAENHFHKVVLGLSGGIDSALTSVLAVDALGAQNVTAVMMKTKFTSDLSLRIAQEMALLNGFKYIELNIEPLVEAQAAFFEKAFQEKPKKIVLENIQARIRGQILMAFSNQTGALVLACGNKSEALTGYCTLYGDTCGGLAPIGNLYKTTVFKLAKWRNEKSFVLPESVITRAPSAELAEGQKDENSLPPYDMLDAVLKELVDNKTPLNQLQQKGIDADLAQKVFELVQRSVFKRAQMAKALEV